MEIARAAGTAPLRADQRQALARLHDVTQQFEGVFIGMLFKEMRKTESDMTLTGKKSSGEKIFGEMLDDQRASALAKTGSFGLGQILEGQLKAAVLGDAARESKVRVDGGTL